MVGNFQTGRRIASAIGPAVVVLLAGAACWGAWEESRRWVMVGALFAWAAVLLASWARKAPMGTGTILAVAVVLRLILFPLPPVLSDDIYRYLWDGILTVEGINPFAHRPVVAALESYRSSPLFEELNSADHHTVYPASSQALFAVGALFRGAGTGAGLYAIKGLLALCELGALLLLARMVAPRKLLLYAWHPVVVLESWGQAHTEAIAVLGIVASVWALRRGKGAFAGAAVAAAGWAKLVPLFFLPFLWRRAGWPVAVAAAVVSALLWAPFAVGFSPAKFQASLDLYVRSFEFNAGPYYALKWVTTMPLRLSGLIPETAETSKVLGPFLRYCFFAGVAAFWWKERRWRLSFPAAAAAVMMLFLLTTTTVHPWYLTPLLALVCFCRSGFWSWHWLSVASLGTYLFYSHGVYWPFVWLAWGGWALIFAWKDGPELLAVLMRQRAWEKWALLRAMHDGPWAGKEVLDLGAGEGYVAELVRDEGGAAVTLADVADLNRTGLPLARCDGDDLPFEDGRFDSVIVVYVLHHCAAAERVVAEALRVSRGQVLVVESVHDAPWNHRLLRFLDRIANRVRSGGKMTGQEEHLRFRTVEEWKAVFESAGARVEEVARIWSPVHRKAVFRLSRGPQVRA